MEKCDRCGKKVKVYPTHYSAWNELCLPCIKLMGLGLPEMQPANKSVEPTCPNCGEPLHYHPTADCKVARS